MKKIIVLFVALFLSVAGIIAQTSLAPGDLAFTSYTSDNPDEFSFVVLEDIDSATVISFTDHGWLSTGAFRTNENVIVWTSGVAIAKGTIITINSTAPSIGSTTGAMPAFSGSGDQVFAFQGTVAMPSLIAGLNMDGAWVATATSSKSRVGEFDHLCFLRTMSYNSYCFSKPNALIKFLASSSYLRLSSCGAYFINPSCLFINYVVLIITSDVSLVNHSLSIFNDSCISNTW